MSVFCLMALAGSHNRELSSNSVCSSPATLAIRRKCFEYTPMVTLINLIDLANGIDGLPLEL